MAGISNYFATQILNLMRAQPMYLALFNGDPDAGGTEVTSQIAGNGRPSISFDAPVNKIIKNSLTIDLGNALNDSAWTFLVIYDAKSGGNLWHSEQSAERKINKGDIVKWLPGDLKFTIVPAQ